LEAIEGDVMDAGTTVSQSHAVDEPSAAEVADTLSTWAVGAGVITIALAPLALPILALTAVALLPLLVPVLAVGAVVALVALPVRLVRAIARRRSARRRPGVSLRETPGLAR
jgi:hypothetical protein